MVMLKIFIGFLFAVVVIAFTLWITRISKD